MPAISRWALVLAAGDGSRLRHLTTDPEGRVVPKQFCRFGGATSLLAETVRRAARVVPGERILTVVAARHEPWWRHDLAAFPAGNVVVQPENRGTAAGILLPLLALLERDPDAAVVILPSDHFVATERVLTRAVNQAFRALHHRPEQMLLLGMKPEAADPELGWIVPRADSDATSLAVDRFVEKPAPALAQQLLAEGGLLASFILVAKARTLAELFFNRQPELTTRLGKARAREAAGIAGALADAYPHLPVKDFSRDLLEGHEAGLRVVAVPPCGWSDLGTPERLAEALNGPFARRRGREPFPWPETIRRFLDGGEPVAVPAVA